MSAWLGTSPGVWSGVVVLLMGAAAWMTGRAVANTWRPAGQVLLYCVLLGAGARFLVFALFDGRLLSATGFASDAVVLIAIGLAGYRVTRVRRMVQQYPWLYEPAGLWTCRRRGS